MFENEYIIGQPVFFLFIAFSCILTFGYFWGRKENKRLSKVAFNELVDVFKPDEQTFTNIGGAIGYHANLFVRKNSFISRVDATITLLPRHSWLYMPISKLIRRYDRLFVTVYLKQAPRGEVHLIETAYARFRRQKITNEDRLNKESIKWGKHDFNLYYENLNTCEEIKKLVSNNPEPGVIRHIAVMPEQKRCFIFMIPRKNEVAKSLAPVYQWLPTIIKQKG